MTIYNLSAITSTGYPYASIEVKEQPRGIELFLRFFDFTNTKEISVEPLDPESSFDLNAGLISALFEFARNMDKRIKTLEFKSKESDDSLDFSKKPRKYEGDVLITLQTETYLLDKSVREKVKLIYDAIISYKIPLESAQQLGRKERKKIIDILTDVSAKAKISKNIGEIKLLAEDFLDSMKDYGLDSIVITSFDLSPIRVFGDTYSFDDVEIILRNVGKIPDIDPLQWKYRQSFHEGKQTWVYLINSGVGVTVERLFEPYFYLMIARPDSYLGEFPAKLARSFNLVLG